MKKKKGNCSREGKQNQGNNCSRNADEEGMKRSERTAYCEARRPEIEANY